MNFEKIVSLLKILIYCSKTADLLGFSRPAISRFTENGLKKRNIQ